MVWPREKDATGQNIKINYGMNTRGEKKKRTPSTEGVQAAITATNLEQDKLRNREEWLLDSGRRRQLL
jgi:hypothetical protein